MTQTRTVTETLFYLLVLNNMTGNTEGATLVAMSDDRERLVNWYNEQMAPELVKEEGKPSFPSHGESHTWHKTFKVGGPLEWYNPADLDKVNHYGHGIQEQWCQEENVNQSILRI
jgi:hypothetical protein